MKLATAIKKATKATGSEPTVKGQFYYFTFENSTISFAINGRMSENATVTNFKTVTGKDETNTMIDYFDGTFHNNLTQALKFIGAL